MPIILLVIFILSFEFSGLNYDYLNHINVPKIKKKIMKKLILVLLCFYGIILNNYAQYPIPSYNVLVFPKATFMDGTTIPNIFKKYDPMEKIRIVIQILQKTPDSIPIVTTVYAEKTDKSVILGPFYIKGNNTLYIDVDDENWGVLVESDYPEDVSVWFVYV